MSASLKNSTYQSSRLTPIYISFILGMIMRSQYLFYAVLEMSYFYLLSLKETFIKKKIVFIFTLLTTYYVLIRNIPMVITNN